MLMAGYRDDDQTDSFVKDSISAKNLGFFLLAPAVFGLFLLLTAERGSYVQIGIGVLLLTSAPFVGRTAWKRYFPD
jgi:hypothetical protein